MSSEYEVDPFRIIAQQVAVFPTDPGDKRPVARNPKQHPVPRGLEKPVARISWSKEATTDPAQVERWVKEYPGCRWGTPTGDLNGFIAVDVDSAQADDWWNEKWFPEGSDVGTPSGGRHIRYEVDPGMDIQTNKSKVTDGIDIRGEGGYIVAYTDDYSNFPQLPESVAELLPRRTRHDAEEDDAQEARDSEYVAPEYASEVTEQEKRVLKGITDTLDALPRPWRKGAGYHDVQFRAACHLHRIANSPHYATDEATALAIFNEHAPVNAKYKPDAMLRQQRWDSARLHTEGQVAEHPGDTPIRLDVTDELLTKYADSEVDNLFWESKNIGQVKKLIRALRHKGATEQEAYSISYECAAMKRIRKANTGSSSTWGFVVKEYESPAEDEAADEEWGEVKPKKKTEPVVPVVLLTEEERAIIRRYPNFIDNYIETARIFYAKPNLPLHYVNAWIALSIGIGDKGSIYEQKGRTPLSLWALNLAPSAAGKTDATDHMEATVNAMRAGGFGSVAMGDDSSAEQLLDVVMERPGKASGIFMDECREFLDGAKRPGSYESKVLGAYLKLYDGKAKRQLRRGMDMDKVGEEAEISFTLWMQGAWGPVVETMDSRHIENGFVGRFIVAVGGEAQVTRDSLTPQIASEYQVENSGRHPMMDSFAVPVRQMVAHLDGERQRMGFASREVVDRYVDMREKLEAFASKHPLSEYLRGVLLRVGQNMLKGAALIALSEGRTLIEMEDLLIAIKSGEWWVKGSLELAEAVSASAYRRLVDGLVALVESRRRSTASILKSPLFQNMKKFEVDEVIDRAEKEGRIRLVQNVWEVAE